MTRSAWPRTTALPLSTHRALCLCRDDAKRNPQPRRFPGTAPAAPTFLLPQEGPG